jgi:ankyrin repeat protein
MAAAVEQQHAGAIIKAAERGDLEEVRRLVQQDRMLLDAESDNMSPLTAAAARGRVQVVRYLLDEGADINLWTSWYGNALGAASSRGRLAVVSLLLARGADTAPGRYGWTPLMAASGNGHTDIVELLLAHGCGDVDAQGPPGCVALHYACFKGRAGMVRALLGAGANPHLVDHDGRPPLRYAAGADREGCVALLQVISLCA